MSTTWIIFNISEMIVPTAIIYPIILSRSKEKYGFTTKTLTSWAGYFATLLLSALPSLLDGRHGLDTENSAIDIITVILVPIVVSWIVIWVMRLRYNGYF